MAKVTLDKNETYIAASNADIFGNTGSETVKVTEGVSVKTDANVERVEFARASTEYTFKAVNTGIEVLYAGATVASVQAGEKLVFSNGSAAVAGTFNSATNTTTYTLGGQTVTTAGGGLLLTLSTAPGETSTITEYTSTDLTELRDNLVGTPGNDVFTSDIIDNTNSLQNGDRINGNGGTDSLEAVIGASQTVVIRPVTDNVANAAFKAQANVIDSNDNNMSNNRVQIDADGLHGITRLEDFESRADLVIEDVRTDSKLVTIAMTGTDPGNVDYAVYFDQHALNPNSNTTSQIYFDLRDGLADASVPLGNLNVNGVRFNVGTQQVTIASQAINDAQTYTALETALKAQLVALQTGTDAAVAAATKDLVVTRLSPGFTQINGLNFSGDRIVITDKNSTEILSSPAFTQVTEVTGPFTFLGNFVVGSPVTATELITTNIELDDVGRGNMGGDLVVGGLSVGTTDDCVGVEQFNVKVLKDSELQILASTNNKLEVVNIVNETGFTGDLTITGSLAPNGNGDAAAADGTDDYPLNPYGNDTHNQYGLTDVRVVNASSFAGDLNLDAVLSEEVVDKFMNLKDAAPSLANADQTANPFTYNLGAGNDTLKLTLDRANLEQAGTVTREDFVLNVAGNGGNDDITVTIANVIEANFNAGLAADVPATGAIAGEGNWYANSKLNARISIDAGALDDTVRTPSAGDYTVELGSGRDVLYSDTTGARSAWVFNTVDQLTVGADADRALENLLSATNTTTNYIYPTVTNVGDLVVNVTFRGLVVRAVIPTTVAVDPANALNTIKSYTDLQLNQAIKAAINDPAGVLSELLVATDGPSNTLVVKSLIDGVTLDNAILIGVTDSQAVPVVLPVSADYASMHANLGGVEQAGSAAADETDNTFHGNTGNDIMVLSTSILSSNTLQYKAAFDNDTVLNFNANALVDPSNDFFDFTVLGGDSGLNLAVPVDNVNTGGGVNTADKSISVVTLATIQANALLTDAQEVAAFFAATPNVTATTHIVIAYDVNNVGFVYTVADPALAGAATATLVGSIDLADTQWATITDANFV